jgi:hypothetical protein
MHEIRLTAEFNKEFIELRTKAEKGNCEARYLLEIVEKGLAKLMASRRRASTSRNASSQRNTQ